MMYSVSYLENLTGSSYNGLSNTYQTARLTHAIVKVYRLRTACLEYQVVLTQRTIHRLGLSSAGTIKDLA
jgi:hypothetical protein